MTAIATAFITLVMAARGRGTDRRGKSGNLARAQELGLRITTVGGGQSRLCAADGALMISMERLRGIQILPRARVSTTPLCTLRVRVQLIGHL